MITKICFFLKETISKAKILYYKVNEGSLQKHNELKIISYP